jgi:hypothetical protein
MYGVTGKRTRSAPICTAAQVKDQDRHQHVRRHMQKIKIDTNMYGVTNFASTTIMYGVTCKRSRSTPLPTFTASHN